MAWWHGGMVAWWHGGMVAWWHGGMVAWWHGGMVAWWHGGMVAWWHGAVLPSALSTCRVSPRYPRRYSGMIIQCFMPKLRRLLPSLHRAKPEKRNFARSGND